MGKKTCWLQLLCVVVLVLITSCTTEPEQVDGWQAYKQSFLSQDGSIVDAVNGNIRHSEGQGMGMLLATANDDRESFDRIWLWTKQHLQVRKHDVLLAWRWQPDVEPHVSDYNNATDGDILVAWGLLRAYKRWGEESYLHAAKALLKDIRQHLIVYYQGRLLLLPGNQGFEKPEGYIINLSYWVFPALAEFQRFEDKEMVWPSLIQSGLELIDESLFGVWKLPPDWLMVGKKLYPAPQFPQRFGLDAVRIPLYLYWAGYNNHQGVQSATHFWQQFTGHGAWPEWVSLEDSLIHMADQIPGLQVIAKHLMQKKDFEVNIDWKKTEYYQTSLVLISQLAEKEKVQ